MEEKREGALLKSILVQLKNIVDVLKFWIDRINKSREDKYSPAFIGWCAAFVSAMLLVIMLFIPPYLGMSDDGSFERMANPAGIYHYEDTRENLYFNYYVKEYLSTAVPPGLSMVYISSHSLFIRAAKWLDDLITRDNHFDLRFLGLLYGILFIPSVALLVKQAAERINTFTERVVAGFAGVLIFTDVSYSIYFSSFYPEAMMYVCFLLCVGASLSLSKEKQNGFYLFLYTFSGILLTTSKQQCALAGLLLGVLSVKFLFIDNRLLWRAGCIASSMLIFFSAMFSFYYIPSDFTRESKYHAMTRGVLFQASNPEKALAEFGIDASYSLLTDISGYDEFPFVSPYSKALGEGFLNRYNSAEIAYYYIKHPKAMLAMMDIAVKSAFEVRRSMSGNYEKSAGMPEMAKSLFWSAWSNFKVRSAPRTIGFVIVLLAASILLFRQKGSFSMKGYRLRDSIPLETMLVTVFIGISQAAVTIINSGDAEMIKHLFLFNISIDILIYFCFIEILHKLNII